MNTPPKDSTYNQSLQIPHSEWITKLIENNKKTAAKTQAYNSVVKVNKRDKVLTKFRSINLSDDVDAKEKIWRIYQDLKINSAEKINFTKITEYTSEIQQNSNTFPTKFQQILNQIRISKGPAYLIKISNSHAQITQTFEYLNGRDLLRYRESRVKKGLPFTSYEIFFTISRLLTGLLYLHNSGILHRDICMKNILVNYVKKKVKNSLGEEVVREEINRVVITNFTKSKYITGRVTYREVT
jgi:serine/threonine protein kinase